MQDRFVSRNISKQARRIISFAGDAGPSRHCQDSLKKKYGDTADEMILR